MNSMTQPNKKKLLNQGNYQSKKKFDYKKKKKNSKKKIYSQI